VNTLRLFRVLLLLSGEALSLGAVAQPTPPKRVAPADLAKYWLVANSTIEADVPNAGHNLDQPTCAAIDYVIERDGTTSHLRLERVAPQGDLGKVALSVVRNLRYAPGPENAARVSVQTHVVIPFNMPEAKGDTVRTAQVLAFRERALAACEPEPQKSPKKP